MTPDIVAMLPFAAAGFLCYTGLVGLSAWYSRATHWQPPAGNQTNDWRLRRNLGFALGGMAVVVCAVASILWQVTWQARLLTLVQATLLAAAGASDLQRFHLPLPLTMAGTALAFITIFTSPVPLFYLLFGLAWAGILIVLHALLSKGSMQLGDHIATVWIALASPANGMLAIAAGDMSNVIFARVKGLRGKKVAAAGAWLIFATALVGLPPYFAWFNRQAQSVEGVQTLAQVPVVNPSSATRSVAETEGITTTSTSTPILTSAEAYTLTSLINMAYWAGEHTASVALIEHHAERVPAAQKEAQFVKRYAEAAQRLAPGSEIKMALADLSRALSVFDLEGIRSASERLALERERLSSVVAGSVVTYTVVSNTGVTTVR